jgi:hypothetical protein
MAAFVIESRALDPSFVLDVAPAVRDYLHSHGGHLFIWFEDIDDMWALQKTSTSPPNNDVEFDEWQLDDFTLHLQRRRSWPGGIRVMLDPWWPFQPIALPAGGEHAVQRRVKPPVTRFTV